MLGLIGVLINAMGSELNDDVSGVAIADISGGLGISHDPSTWFQSLYVSAEIFGLGTSPWFMLTFTLRRWTLFVIALTGISTLLIPFSPNEGALYLFRMFQGLGGGFSIPLLLTAALRVLTPSTRIYGLAMYALTATFTPAMAAPLAALWTNLLGWHWVFWQVIPFSVLAGLLAWAGLPHEQPQYERLRKIDWRGMLLLAVGFGAFSTLLFQGNRLNWWDSQLICVLGLISAVCIPAFVVNEWFHELPLLKLQLLGRRNLAFGLIALFSFLIIGLSASTIPDRFLSEVQGFRPEQFAILSGVVAAPQLLLLPAVAWLLDHEWVDARAVNLIGLMIIIASCAGASFASAYWDVGQFFIWQAMQCVGQPMVVVSLLMMSTNTITDPNDAPYASALVNLPRGVAEATATWLLDLITRWRGGLHYSQIVNQLGARNVRFPSASAAGAAVQQQAEVLTLSDAYLVLGTIALALAVVVLVLPQRTVPPRILLAKH